MKTNNINIMVLGSSFNATEIVKGSESDFVEAHVNRLLIELPKKERAKALKEIYQECLRAVKNAGNGNNTGNAESLAEGGLGEGSRADHGGNGAGNTSSKP